MAKVMRERPSIKFKKTEPSAVPAPRARSSLIHDALAAAPVYSNLEHRASVPYRPVEIISEPHHGGP